MLNNIKSYRKISDKLHSAAQPTTEQFKSIQQASVDLVINLALVDSPGTIENEPNVVQDNGIEYSYIPVDFKKPEITDSECFFQAMDQNIDKNVLVHCAYNWRVPAFVYLYRVIKQEFNDEKAKQDMLAIWEPDETWQVFIDNALTDKERLSK